MLRLFLETMGRARPDAKVRTGVARNGFQQAGTSEQSDDSPRGFAWTIKTRGVANGMVRHGAAMHQACKGSL